MLSLLVCPKVITLGGLYCITKCIYNKSRNNCCAPRCTPFYWYLLCLFYFLQSLLLLHLVAGILIFSIYFETGINLAYWVGQLTSNWISISNHLRFQILYFILKISYFFTRITRATCIEKSEYLKIQPKVAHQTNVRYNKLRAV